jgi:asparagine synthase (glutamine-hydrolysing)
MATIGRRDPVREAAVARMNAAMRHRGPDDGGLWNGGNVALAMRRLSIIDLESGQQPMARRGGNLVLVFNGEVYNHQALRAELEGLGHEFETRSDTEVILAAYEAWGDACLERFNGMFAIALYDRDAERLLLARDRLGIKPLHYCERDGVLLFASELGALMASGIPRTELAPAALDAYLEGLVVPAPDTIYRGVHKLRPGEKLVCESGHVRRERWWRLVYAPDASWTLESAAERYRELLDDAVRLRTLSDVPLGALLSGGLDSSSVVGLLARHSPEPVRTFAVGFDDAHYDELRFARIAADHFGTRHTETMLRPDLATLPALITRHFGEPFADSSALPTWLVSKVAREAVTVALSGDGGDELLAGYTWAHRSRAVRQAAAIPGSVRRLAAGALGLAPDTPVAGKLRRLVGDTFAGPDGVFRRRHTCFLPAQRATLYRPQLAEAVARAACDRFQEHLDEAAGLHPDDRMLYHDTVAYLPDDILTKVDRMSMANSLEARVPLLDHRLAEFAATVPFSLKYRAGVSKRLAKHAVRDLLPARLLAQRKQGFAIPVHQWFRGPLGVLFDETVLAEDSRSAAYFNPDAVRELRTAHREQRENYGHHLWVLLMFEYWARGGPHA